MESQTVAQDVEASYCVVFRCSSRLFIPRGQFLRLPPALTDDGPMEFGVTSEFHESGLPSHLILQTIVSATSVKAANLIAHKPASIAAELIAFANNTYVEAPARWYTYEVKKTTDWRRIGQIEYETARPLVAQRIRQLDVQATQQFVAGFCEGLSQDDAKIFYSAISLYVRALENWQQSRAVFAAHYLFIATERLTPIALAEILAERSLTEAQLLSSYWKQRIPDAPKGATPEDDAAITAIIERMKGPARGGAKNDMKSDVRRKAIFRDSHETYDALRKATDGFEHGYDTFDKTYALALPHMDKAPACIRKWIIDRTISDVVLRSELLEGESKLPLILGKFSFIVGAEFRSENPIVTPAPNRPPFRITPTLENPKADSLMKSVELREVHPYINAPADTFEEESAARAESLEKFFGIKPKGTL